jgi:hypothetical protein
MSTCVVCFEHKDTVECSYCRTPVCKKCLQAYILSQNIEPRCMNKECDKPYNDLFLLRGTSNTWRQHYYAPHMKKVLWEREKQLLPLTVTRAEAVQNERCISRLHSFLKLQEVHSKHRSDLIHRQLDTFKHLLNALTLLDTTQAENMKRVLLQEVHHLTVHLKIMIGTEIPDVSTLDECKLRIVEWQDKVKKEEDHRTLLQSEEYKIQWLQSMFQQSKWVVAAPEAVVEKSRSMRPCPSSECRGYCNVQGVCTLCSLRICLECWVQMNDVEKHACKSEDIASKKLVEKDSKECPKCHVLIYRTEGCDHMWCTSCHTGFNWKTRQIIKDDYNTNPMLADWLHQRSVIDVNAACGDVFIICFQHCSRILQHTPYDFTRDKLNAIRNVIQIFSRFYNTFSAQTHDVTEYNTVARVKYLLKEYTEDQFKNIVFANIKKIKLEQDAMELYQTLAVIVAPLLQQYQSKLDSLHHDLRTDSALKQARFMAIQNEFARWWKVEWSKSIEEVRVYFNSCVDQLGQLYFNTSQSPFAQKNTISPEWTLLGHSRE